MLSYTFQNLINDHVLRINLLNLKKKKTVHLTLRLLIRYCINEIKENMNLQSRESLRLVFQELQV